MRTIRNVFAVDSHTMGEPTRVAIGGITDIPGNTIAAKKTYMESNMDNLRSFLLNEPRGHGDMVGSVILPPVSREASIGVIFMDCGGYLNMCGHGTIGTVKVALEMGLVPKTSPITRFKIETPAGLVEVSAVVDGDEVGDISFINVPSFIYKENVGINLNGYTDVALDICFGGSFFGILPAETLGLKIEKENIPKFIELGLLIRDKINKEYEVIHPSMPHIKKVDLIEFYGPADVEGAEYKNIVIFGNGQFDRSPCGTGTSAKLALMYGRGEIGIGDTVVSESILGTCFKGKILKEVAVGNLNGIVPEISGRAYITGYNHLLIESEDIFKEGFAFNERGSLI
ncbi:MAG: proline racemase family protein [Thermoanaerobacteraceae bacterium]|nr:proline racemase family protein [Thermoanaerobacteraceae bacterium]